MLNLIILSTTLFLQNIKVTLKYILCHFAKHYVTEPVENIILPFVSGYNTLTIHFD